MRNDSLGLFWYDEPPPKPEKKTKPKKTPPEPVWERDDYLPGLEEARNAKYDLLTDNDLVRLAWPNKTTLVFDIECYRNYFLIAFQEVKSRKFLFFELFNSTDQLDTAKLKWVMENFQLVGFYSNHYDIPMATLATIPKTSNHQSLKKATDLLIKFDYQKADLYKEFKVKGFHVNHIDIIEVLPLNGTLKVYAGRIHAPKIQDLPFHPDKTLTDDQKIITRHYCANDLLDTILLTQEISEQLSLRVKLGERYGLDLRSKSDAQIAEAVIRHRVEARKGHRVFKGKFSPGETFKYNVPSYLKFRTPMLNQVLNTIANCDFVVGENGRIGLPQIIQDLQIRIGQTEYQMGIGGLHSKEKSVSYYARNGMVIKDRDVTSYYPEIVIGQRLAPENLGRDFLIEYERIVQERVVAKRNKDKVTADSLKITVNGSFGKFGNLHSIMYSPQLVIQVTVSGQLNLLYLIEMLELNGVQVVSANTDGIVVYTHERNVALFESIVAYWEKVTGFTTEETEYLSLHSRDVNNYIAIKPKGEPKLKGAYRTKDLSKNPVNEVCVNAVVKYLQEGIPFEQTVKGCNDIRDFLSLRVVNGGAFKNGIFYGKTIRWYKSTDFPGTIIYAKSGNDVPLTEGCKPLQVLPDAMPQDIDYDWYIERCHKMLIELGVIYG